MTWINAVLFFSAVLGVRHVSGASSMYTVVSVTVGRTATLPCTVDFQGSPMVLWRDPANVVVTRNEERVTGDTRFSVDRPYTNEWNLQIDNVRSSDQGNYSCLINAVPVQTKFVNLVIVSAPVMISSSPDVAVDTGSDVELQCEAEGTPEPVISWHKYSFKGDRTDLSREGSSLFLTNVTRYDAAVYECEANNGVPPQATETIRLDIHFAPIVRLPHQYLSQERGRDTFLQCTINANPHEDAHWEKEGKVIEDGVKYSVTQQDTERYNMSLFLFIRDLAEKDFGSYECVAENSFGRDSGFVELFEWKSGKARVAIPPEDTISQLNEDIQLNCTVEDLGQSDSLTWWHRHPTLGYQRLFESHPSAVPGRAARPSVVFDSDKYEVVGHYDLVVRNVTFQDAGKYVCELSGGKNYSASVTVVDDLVCDNGYENDTHIVAGHFLDLSCSMAFAGPTRLWDTVWLHQERKISTFEEDTDVFIRRTISFPVFAKDSGSYECLLSTPEFSYRAECGVKITVVEEEAPPAPLCKAEIWDMATSTVAIVAASCVGGTALVFLIVLLCVRSRYRKKIRKLSKSPCTANIYETNIGSRGNGALSMESRHLTADTAEDEV